MVAREELFPAIVVVEANEDGDGVFVVAVDVAGDKLAVAEEVGVVIDVVVVDVVIDGANVFVVAVIVAVVVTVVVALHRDALASHWL